jgi:hypothetical protein
LKKILFHNQNFLKKNKKEKMPCKRCARKMPKKKKQTAKKAGKKTLKGSGFFRKTGKKIGKALGYLAAAGLASQAAYAMANDNRHDYRHRRIKPMPIGYRSNYAKRHGFSEV